MRRGYSDRDGKKLVQKMMRLLLVFLQRMVAFNWVVIEQLDVT